MNKHCPKCLAPISSDDLRCPHCWERRAQFERRLHAIIELIEFGQDTQSLAAMNEVIDLAPVERLAECYAIRGFAQLKKLDFDRAVEDCSESISLDWEQPQAYEWRAAARSKLNQWHLAFDDLDRAYEYGGELQDHYLDLMSVMSAHAHRYYQGLSQKCPLTPDQWFELGWISFRMNKFEKAHQDFNQALKLQPGHPWASVGLGNLYLKRDEFKRLGQVLPLCDDGLTGDTACRWQARSIRAQLHAMRGDLVRAKHDLQDLVSQSSDDVLSLARSAELIMQQNDHVSAIDVWNQILELNRDLVLALRKRGDCFAAICNYGLASEDYCRYLERLPDSVPTLVRRAKVNLAVQKNKAAVDDLRLALQLEPSNYEANLRFGQVNCELGKFDLALNHCRMAVQLDNRQAEGFAVLASVYNRLSDYQPAIEEFSRAIELAPNLPDRSQFRFLRGVAAYENDDFESALADFKQATDERPHHAGSWIWLAATCARQEDWAGAIRALQQAKYVRPSSAQQYQIMGRPVAEKAVDFYRRMEQRHHEHANLYLNRGLAHQFLDQHHEAVKDFRSGLKQHPKDVELLIRRGKSLSEIGEFDAAIADFSSACSLVPDDHRPLFYRALAKIRQLDLPTAKEDLLQAVKLAPNQPRYLLTLGELELRTGNRSRAIDCFDRAILIDPTNPTSYRMRGEAHWAQKDLPKESLAAIRDFTHSLQLDPSQADLLVCRGHAYLKSNQPLTALEDFEAALIQNNQQANAYSGRASILVTQQRHEYALIWLTKAIHRFSNPMDLAEIILARGRVFFEMSRFVPAISDFTTVMDLGQGSPKIEAAARYARALAKLHNQQFDSARKDFKKLSAYEPDNIRFKEVLSWLADPSRPSPAFLPPPVALVRPTRPPSVRTGVVLTHGTVTKWDSPTPHDLWIVKTEDKREFGPVSIQTLVDWASEGRLVNGMKLLRADWSKWKRIETIFPDITPLESLKDLIDDFPVLNTKGNKSE
jgi:tetratricopeptide (TPR) repeat protein